MVCWWVWGGESIIAWLSKSTLLSNIDSVAVSWTRCLSCMAIINKKEAVNGPHVRIVYESQNL